MDKKNHNRSILIAPDEIDLHNVAIGLPWKSDAICMNFNMPKELCLLQDIGNISDKEDIVTLIIDGDLPDYSLIAGMKRLGQLYIYNSRNLSDLSFIENLSYLDQILINESRISSLDCITTLVKTKLNLIDHGQDFWEKMMYSMHGIFINSAMEPYGIDDLLDCGMYIDEIIVNGKRGHKRRHNNS